MATLPDVKEVLMANGVVICPHCNAQNGGIRRYNPGTHTTLLYTETGYQEQEPDTEDENICYVCEECGGPLIVDEKTMKIQPCEEATLLVELVDANDDYPFDRFLIHKTDLVKFREVTEALKAFTVYDRNAFRELLTKKCVRFVELDHEIIAL
jgi:hypothetical protein